MSVETLQQLIDAEAEIESAIEAELQAAAEAAETQAVDAEIKAATDLLLRSDPSPSPPLSSPIDGFASPPPLTLPPSVERTVRSSPRLKLRPSGAVDEEEEMKERRGQKSQRDTKVSKTSKEDIDMSAESGNEEVDELESPIDINPEECERLEAECLQTQRQGSASAPPTTTHPEISEHATTTTTATQVPQSTPATAITQRQASSSPQRSTSSQRQHSKSPFATSASQRGSSPFAKITPQSQKSTPAATAIQPKNFTIARSSSNTASSSQRTLKRTRGSSAMRTTESIDLTRDSPEPTPPPAKRVKDQEKLPTPALSEEWVQNLMATSRGPRPDSPPAEGHATDPRSSQSRVTKNGARPNHISATECKATNLKRAMEKAEEAVREMERACEEVVGEMAIKLCKCELEIDRLRAKLKVRPSKKGGSSGASQGGDEHGTEQGSRK